jgi:hypothetical protein
MLKFFLQYWMFAFTMFAAGAPAIGESGGADGTQGADLGGSESNDSISGDTTDSDGEQSSSDAESGILETVEEPDQQQQQERPEDKDTADLKGLVSKRLLALKKEAPELTAVFAKYPKVQEQVEAAFRRDMAYRELYPTVAEARQMREQFPNGMADVEQLQHEIGEVEQLDKNFYGRDAQGNYAGHSQLIQSWFQDDRNAMVSMFRTVPKEWARLDPDSYNEVMGSIVGSTLQRGEIPEWLGELIESSDDPKNLPAIKASLGKLLKWSQGFMKRKAEPSEDERRLTGQREQFQREQTERQQQDFTRFRQTFTTDSRRLQESIIRKHPAIAETLATKALPDAKKAEIVEKVRKAIENHLKSSRAFMSKLTPLYKAGNLAESLTLQKAQWSYPWVLNKFVRAVLAEETPNLVRQNRERTRGAATQSQRQPEKRGQQQQTQQRTGPYQDGGVWRKKDGSRFTTAEILRGLHLQA